MSDEVLTGRVILRKEGGSITREEAKRLCESFGAIRKLQNSFHKERDRSGFEFAREECFVSFFSLASAKKAVQSINNKVGGKYSARFPEPTPVLFIKGLLYPRKSQEKDLRKCFCRHGRVIDVCLFEKAEGAFLTFASVNESIGAIKSEQGTVLYGGCQSLIIDFHDVSKPILDRYFMRFEFRNQVARENYHNFLLNQPHKRNLKQQKGPNPYHEHHPKVISVDRSQGSQNERDTRPTRERKKIILNIGGGAHSSPSFRSTDREIGKRKVVFASRNSEQSDDEPEPKFASGGRRKVVLANPERTVILDGETFDEGEEKGESSTESKRVSPSVEIPSEENPATVSTSNLKPSEKNDEPADRAPGIRKIVFGGGKGATNVPPTKATGQQCGGKSKSGDSGIILEPKTERVVNDPHEVDSRNEPRAVRLDENEPSSLPSRSGCETILTSRGGTVTIVRGGATRAAADTGGIQKIVFTGGRKSAPSTSTSAKLADENPNLQSEEESGTEERRVIVLGNDSPAPEVKRRVIFGGGRAVLNPSLGDSSEADTESSKEKTFPLRSKATPSMITETKTKLGSGTTNIGTGGGGRPHGIEQRIETFSDEEEEQRDKEVRGTKGTGTGTGKVTLTEGKSGGIKRYVDNHGRIVLNTIRKIEDEERRSGERMGENQSKRKREEVEKGGEGERRRGGDGVGGEVEESRSERPAGKRQRKVIGGRDEDQMMDEEKRKIVGWFGEESQRESGERRSGDKGESGKRKRIEEGFGEMESLKFEEREGKRKRVGEDERRQERGGKTMDFEDERERRDKREKRERRREKRKKKRKKGNQEETKGVRWKGVKMRRKVGEIKKRGKRARER